MVLEQFFVLFKGEVRRVYFWQDGNIRYPKCSVPYAKVPVLHEMFGCLGYLRNLRVYRWAVFVQRG